MSVKARLAQLREANNKGQPLTAVSPKVNQASEPKMLSMSNKHTPRLKDFAEYSQSFTLSGQQQQAADAIVNGESCCVVGVAGAGKTATLVSGILGRVRKVPPLLQRNSDYYRYQYLCDPDHKYLRQGNPGIVVVAATNSAVRNLASRLPHNMSYVYEDENGETVSLGNINPRTMCISIHKLLQFRLMDTDVDDVDIEDMDDDYVAAKSWQPYRRKGNYLPPELRTIVVDEATLPNVALMRMLMDAIHPAVPIQVVSAGDLFQIQAVGGMSELAAFSTFMNVYTLTHCYRHDGAIINLATKIRKQQTEYLMPGSDILEGDAEHGKTRRITYGVRNPPPDSAMNMIAAFLSNGILKGSFVPGLDMAICFHDPILQGDIPKFGITTLYRKTQERVDKERGTLTHFVRLASRSKHGVSAVIVAAGDVIQADFGGSRSVFMVLRCQRNPKYRGKIYPPMRYATRNPDLWLNWARADEGTISDDFMEAALNMASDWDEVSSNLDELMDEAGASEFDGGEEGSGKVGRKATHYLHVVDLAQIQVEIASRAHSSADAELLLEHVIKRLDYAARLMDYKVYTQGLTIPDTEFVEALRNMMDMYGLRDVFNDSLVKVDRGAELKDIKPWLSTAHSAQGLSGRNVVVATHSDIPAFTEYVYTACTRARQMLITFSHAHFWGLPSEELVQQIIDGSVVHPDVSKTVAATKDPRKVRGAIVPTWRSDVHKAQIAGTTIPDKVDSIFDNLKAGKGGVSLRDLDQFKIKLFGSSDFVAPTMWRNNYEDE